MIRINLLPVRAAQKKEKLRSQVSVFALSVVLVCIVCGVEYFRMTSKINEKIDQVNKVKAEISQLQKKTGEVSRYKKLQGDLKKKLDILHVLKENKSGPVHILNELSLALPEKLWIQDFSVRNDNVKLNGLCFSESIVAEFMRNLEKSKYYKNIELNVTQLQNVNDVKLQKFSLTGLTEKQSEK